VTSLLTTPLLAKSIASIVYGSYSTLKRAESHKAKLENVLGNTLRIAEFNTRGAVLFRVMGPAENNINQLRLTLATTKKNIEPDAWLYIHEQVEDSQTASRSKTLKPVSAVLIQSKSRGEKSHQPTQVETNNKNPFHVKNAKTTTAYLKRPAGDVIRIQPQASGGVDATIEPIVLEKFADDDIDITIDCYLEEAVWGKVTGYNNMTILEPDTLEVPRYSTITKLIYTDKGLYVGIWNEQPVDKLIPRLTKRDEYINRDGNHFTLDTSGEGLYGFWFDVNLGGSVTDGKVLPEYQFSREWDGPWQGDAKQVEDGFTTEMFLPWSMMAMPETGETRQMGFYTSRRVSYLDERWGWPALPMTGSKFMSGLQPISLNNVNPKQQYAFFPFASTTFDNSDSESAYRTGVDIFWRPTSNMQITASLNPDFGTVESDNVVVNLTAEETYFPEKRLFFLEGNEIFVTTPRSTPRTTGTSTGARTTKSSFNPTPTTLVNTRRIGGQAPDPDIPGGVHIPDIELGKPTELIGAFKVTGQSGQLRYGFLSAFEEDQKFHGEDTDDAAIRVDQEGRDFGVIRLLYENSNNGRKGIGWMSTAVTHSSKDAYVHGIDGHYLNPSSTWQVDGQLMFSDVDSLQGYGGFVDATYIPERGKFHRFTFDYLDENLDVTDFGFVRRNDVIVGRYMYNYSTSDVKNLRNRSNSWVFDQEYNIDGRVIRSGIFWRTGWTFLNSMQLRTELNYFPERWDDLNSEGNGEFKIEDRWYSEIGIGTDSSKALSMSLALGKKQEDLGGWTDVVKGGFTYKPNDRFSLDVDLNYFNHDGWLLHQDGRLFTTYKAENWQPRIAMDVFISAKQQLRFTLQWAGIKAQEQNFYQIPEGDGELIDYPKGPEETTDNFTISRITSQLRYRWEIAPLSDLFIVYTRGANVETRRHDDFESLFTNAWTSPLVDVIVVKLRYRFGN
jgi:hypothetical protein